jgi:hypothetical protein
MGSHTSPDSALDAKTKHRVRIATARGCISFDGNVVERTPVTCRPPFDTLRANGVGRESVAKFAVRAEPVEARILLVMCLPEFDMHPLPVFRLTSSRL